MKYISILLTLLIVGYLVYRQLNTTRELDVTSVNNIEAIGTPKVPTNPKDVPKFNEDINKFIDDAAAKRKKQIESAEQ